MYGSLFWIDWLDRLDRVLTSARQDVLALRRTVNPRGMAGIQRCIRQLTALTNDLRLLDRSVLAPGQDPGALDLTDNLQKALETTLFRLGTLAEVRAGAGEPVNQRILSAIDSALRDSLYEAASLLEPGRRRAHAAPRAGQRA